MDYLECVYDGGRERAIVRMRGEPSRENVEKMAITILREQMKKRKELEAQRMKEAQAHDHHGIPAPDAH